MTDVITQISTKESTTMENITQIKVDLTDRMVPEDILENTFPTCELKKDADLSLRCILIKACLRFTVMENTVWVDKEEQVELVVLDLDSVERVVLVVLVPEVVSDLDLDLVLVQDRALVLAKES